MTAENVATVTDAQLLAIAREGRNPRDPLLHATQTVWEDVRTLSRQDLATMLWYYRQHAKGRHGWMSDLRQLEREWARRAAGGPDLDPDA